MGITIICISGIVLLTIFVLVMTGVIPPGHAAGTVAEFTLIGGVGLGVFIAANNFDLPDPANFRANRRHRREVRRRRLEQRDRD